MSVRPYPLIKILQNKSSENNVHCWRDCGSGPVEYVVGIIFNHMCELKFVDPPGPGRIDGHYLHTGCPYIHPPSHETKTRYSAKRKHAITLHVAWWVTLKSRDFFTFFLSTPKHKPKHKLEKWFIILVMVSVRPYKTNRSKS